MKFDSKPQSQDGRCDYNGASSCRPCYHFMGHTYVWCALVHSGLAWLRGTVCVSVCVSVCVCVYAVGPVTAAACLMARVVTESDCAAVFSRHAGLTGKPVCLSQMQHTP